MLIREDFNQEISQFEKLIDNTLTGDCKQALWRFFRNRDNEYFRMVLKVAFECKGQVYFRFVNGHYMVFTPPRDINSLQNLIERVIHLSEEQNKRWAKTCRWTNYLWGGLYLAVFISYLIVRYL